MLALAFKSASDITNCAPIAGVMRIAARAFFQPGGVNHTLLSGVTRAWSFSTWLRVKPGKPGASYAVG
jgi:hypothetical protein